MHFSLSISNLLRIIAALLLCASAPALAITCKEANSGNLSHTFTLDHEVKVSTGNMTPGTVLWRSQTYTSSFTCTDTDNAPEGEGAYLYWDPGLMMSSIDPSLEVGITYQGRDINPADGGKEPVGQGTYPDPNYPNNCRRKCVAIPNTITVSYAVYIKATGLPPPSNGQINSTGTYRLFQVDGKGGTKQQPDSNFNALINGLGNIKFISCNPTISVEANQGNVVDFGRIPAANAKSGNVEKSMPFTVVANLSGDGVGGDCKGQTLQASFSTTYSLDGLATILPSPDAGFGIFISQPSSSAAAIDMKTPVDMGTIGSDTARLEAPFLANLKWLSDKPKIGPFSATANIDVTFK